MNNMEIYTVFAKFTYSLYVANDMDKVMNSNGLNKHNIITNLIKMLTIVLYYIIYNYHKGCLDVGFV